ncbi:MAG: hypothetical protein QF733_01680 [Phycisphaerales bacterium]|jgi:hypothetical protein|nr:hypothetical protein [Phycisphaerales bacterium]
MLDCGRDAGVAGAATSGRQTRCIRIGPILELAARFEAESVTYPLAAAELASDAPSDTPGEAPEGH